MIVSRSSRYIDRPWHIERKSSARNATGWRYCVVVEGAHRMPEAQSLNEALKLVQTMTREGER